MWASKFLTFRSASFGLIESDGVFRLLEIEEEEQEFLGPTLREAWSGPVKANQPGLPPLQGVWNRLGGTTELCLGRSRQCFAAEVSVPGSGVGTEDRGAPPELASYIPTAILCWTSISRPSGRSFFK